MYSAMAPWHIYLGAIAMNLLSAIVNLWAKTIARSVLGL